jgi:hypothetical protein
MEKMPALLIRTCKGAARAFQASANLATESNERRSTSIALASQNEMSMNTSKYQLMHSNKFILISKHNHFSTKITLEHYA